MPFENNSGQSDDAIVARLDVGIKTEDIDATKAIGQAAKELLTAFESVTRFSETHLEFVEQTLKVQQELVKAQDEILKQRNQEDQQDEKRRQQQQKDRQETERQKDQDRSRKKQEQQEDADYRQKLAQEMSDASREQLSRRNLLDQQLAGNPDQLFTMLKDRGFISESIKNGEVSHEVKLPGGKSFNAADLRSQANYEQALDQLSQSTGQETGSLVDRLGGVSSNLNLALRGLRQGGSVADSVRATEGLLGNLSKSGGSTGALAGAAGLAGKALPFVGGALAANGIFNQATDFYQDYRLQGAAKGGGFGQGLQYEASIRAMALNPFISTDQARQIIMGAVNEGYTGKQFDDVTDFVKANFTSMGIDINKSFKMIKTSVQEGGESLEDLATSIQKIKAGAKIGNMGVAEATDEFQNVSQSVVDAGYGEYSLEVTEQITSRFKGEKDIPLKGVMGKIANAFMNNSSLWVPLQKYASQLGVSTTPPLVVGDLMAAGQFVPAIEMYLADLANRAEQSSQGGAVREPWNVFWQMLTNYGIPVKSKNEAKLLYERYGNGGITAVQNDAEGYEAQVNNSVDVNDAVGKAAASALDITTGGNPQNVTDAQKDAFANARNVKKVTDEWTGKNQNKNKFWFDGDTSGTKGYLMQHLGKTGASIPELSNLISQGEGFQVYDENGKLVSLKNVDWNNLGNAAKIADGRWKFTDLGADKKTGKSFGDYYSDFANETAQGKYLSDLKAGKNVAPPTTVKVQIEAKGDLAKYLQATEGGTANQKRSNMGEGGATENNPSVGDR